jgi:hypothetical protein
LRGVNNGTEFNGICAPAERLPHIRGKRQTAKVKSEKQKIKGRNKRDKDLWLALWQRSQPVLAKF